MDVGECKPAERELSMMGEVIEGANGPNKHRFRGQPIPWVGYSEGCNWHALGENDWISLTVEKLVGQDLS